MNLHHSFHKNHRLAPLKSGKARPSVSDSVVATSTGSVSQFLIPNSSFLIDFTNQLDHVIDAAGDVAGAADIGSQSSGNYLYNSIGQLTDNKGERVKYVYNTAGLVTQVSKNGQTQLSITYNDRGQRLSKTSPSGTTHYVRDAAGSVLGIYFNQSLTEQPVYGNSRLGVRYRGSGKTAYQLSDHLGNVRAVVMENEGNAISITNKTDYYPFGMPMPNRQTTDGDYRYGYQGEFARIKITSVILSCTT